MFIHKKKKQGWLNWNYFVFYCTLFLIHTYESLTHEYFWWHTGSFKKIFVFFSNHRFSGQNLMFTEDSNPSIRYCVMICIEEAIHQLATVLWFASRIAIHQVLFLQYSKLPLWAGRCWGTYSGRRQLWWSPGRKGSGCPPRGSSLPV